MPSQKLQELRQRFPNAQGLSDADIFQRLVDVNRENGTPLSSEDQQRMAGEMGLEIGNTRSGLFRGIVAGLNPFSEAITRALVPDIEMLKGVEDYLATAHEARIGESNGHMLGNLLGTVGGLALGPGAGIGALAKAAKGVQMVNGVAKLNKGWRGAQLGLQGVMGAAQGYRQAQLEGSRYNDGAGPIAPLANAAIQGTMNVVPGFSSLKTAIAGNAGLGALSAANENLMQMHNGLRQDFDMGDLASGAAEGAILGGGLHALISGPGAYKGWKAKRAETAAAQQAAADAATKAKANPNPVQPQPIDPEVTAFAEAAQSAGFNNLSPEQWRELRQHQQELARVRGDIQARQVSLGLQDPENFPTGLNLVVRRADDATAPFFRQAAEDKVSGVRGTTFINDQGELLRVPGDEVRELYYKSFMAPEGLENIGGRQIIVPPGFYALEPTLDVLDGKPVWRVGRSPIGKGKELMQKYLVVDPTDAESFLRPNVVEASKLSELGAALTAARKEVVTPESTLSMLQGGRKMEATDPKTLALELQEAIDELNRLDRLVQQRPAPAGTRSEQEQLVETMAAMQERIARLTEDLETMRQRKPRAPRASRAKKPNPSAPPSKGTTPESSVWGSRMPFNTDLVTY